MSAPALNRGVGEIRRGLCGLPEVEGGKGRARLELILAGGDGGHGDEPEKGELLELV
jgi:hypothetical protein